MAWETKNGLLVRPMNVQVSKESEAELYYKKAAEAAALAAGIAPSPSHDLIRHPGKIVPDSQYVNYFVKSTNEWDADERKKVDAALKAAMVDKKLEGIMKQYFPSNKTSCTALTMRDVDLKKDRVGQGDIQKLVKELFEQNEFKNLDLSKTLFNFLLPPGVELFLIDGEPDSRQGLGGYHGSVVLGDTRLYYAVDVYSHKATTSAPRNGIPAFDSNWKNSVATAYHELNEFRTDPDVQEAIDNNDSNLLGWNSRQGEEIGDFPIKEAPTLNAVFQEIDSDSNIKIPVQFMYSNESEGPGVP